MKFTPLRLLPLTVKVLITCFLVTLSLGNIAAGVYTQKYVVISYESLVETYSEKDDVEVVAPSLSAHTNEFGEREITLDQVREMPHRVSLKLLLQDAHVHLFSHGVLSLLIGILFLWTQLPERWKLILIPMPFLGGTLDFVGMFLVKFLADGFAYLIIFSGALTAVSFLIVFFVSMYEMWFSKIKA